jgi:hypothetical protein
MSIGEATKPFLQIRVDLKMIGIAATLKGGIESQQAGSSEIGWTINVDQFEYFDLV